MSGTWAHRRRLVGALASSCLTIVAGCGTDADSPSTSTVNSSVSSSTTQVTTTSAGIPDPPAPDEWVATTDPATGVSFSLPGQPVVESRPANAEGTSAAATMYRVEVVPDFGLSVSFAEAPAADYSAEGLDSVADSIVAGLKSAGATDVDIKGRQHSTVAGHPALDFQLAFTAKNGTSNIWFARFIGNGTRAIQLQSIAFVQPDDTESVKVIEKYHQQLIATVRIP
jgi:hypothetical protein